MFCFWANEELGAFINSLPTIRSFGPPYICISVLGLSSFFFIPYERLVCWAFLGEGSSSVEDGFYNFLGNLEGEKQAHVQKWFIIIELANKSTKVFIELQESELRREWFPTINLKPYKVHLLGLWRPPSAGVFKLNTVEFSIGNPGSSGV